MAPLDWIDEYVVRLRDYIFVREDDCLLIKVPNEAYKLNPSGIEILQRLLGGEPVADLWRSYGGTDEVRRDIHDFFTGLKQVLEKKIDERRLPASVVARPFQLGFNTLPVLSEVALTYACNLECRFCYAQCHNAGGERGGWGRAPARPVLAKRDFQEVLRIIRQEAKVPSVSFTGGEPTLCPDLPDLVRYARHTLGMRVNLITNGTLIDLATARALHDAGLHSAQVSIESPDPDVHDALTCRSGSFAQSLAGLRALRDSGVSVHTNTTINRLNIATLLKMPAFVKSLGLERFSMNLVIPMRHDPAINLSYTEAAPWIPRIQGEARRYGVEFMWYSPTPVCIFNPIPYQLGNKGCAACDGLLSVSPSGDVLPCSSWPEPVGNLLLEGFHSTWRSARACRLRGKNEAPAACSGCEDFALCQGACPLYWREFGTCELLPGRKRHAAAGC
ncbi:MAG TPA: radical SAM protein [Candidatus Bathyarchaeia archaeon]|nr:radical SAM protein [Candidatus Bathyarchaeia archaeon]